MPEYHAAVTAFVDQATTTTEIQMARDCAQRLVDACPLTPITTPQSAAARRTAFDALKATIANTEDAIKPYKSRLHQIGACFRERMDSILYAPRLRAEAVARLLGEWDLTEAKRAREQRLTAINAAVDQNIASDTNTATTAIVDAIEANPEATKTGPTRKAWIMTVTDEAAVWQRIMGLLPGSEHAIILRPCLRLHLPSLKKHLAGPGGQAIIDAAALPGVSVRQETKAVARRRPAAPPATCNLCGEAFGTCEHTAGARTGSGPGEMRVLSETGVTTIEEPFLPEEAE